MIICPRCNVELEKRETLYICPGCRYKAKIKDEIIFFNPEITPSHSDYKKDKIEKLYKYEQSHFWFKNRRKIIVRAIKTYVGKDKRIIEIGAGTGSIMRSIINEGYKNVSVGEIHGNGLVYAKGYGVRNLFQFDVLRSPFKEHFDAIGMFDVIEHLSDDRKAIKESHRMLSRGGRLFITVPAHMWLWSTIDESSGHKRRYSIKNVNNLLKDNGFKIIKSKYFFSCLIPFLLFRKLLNPKTGDDRRGQGLEIGRYANLILDSLVKTEDRLLGSLNIPFGGSILVIGEKK